MAIQKRLNKAGKKIYIARWRDPAGKEHSKSFAREGEAKEYLRQMQNQVDRGVDTSRRAKKGTVKDIFDGWIYHRPLRPASIQIYEFTRDNYLGWLADWPASEVSSETVTRWFLELQTGRSWQADNAALSETTARNALRHVRTAMRWAEKQGKIDRNPVIVPKYSHVQAVDPDVIPSDADINRVISRLRSGGAQYWESKRKDRAPQQCTQGPSPVYADMLFFAASTGMRISELCGLTVADVDLQAGVVKVRKQLGKQRPVQRVELKTARSRRDVPISEALRPVAERLTRGRRGGDYVFVSRGGRPVIHSRAAVAVKRAAVHEGAELVHFHALRHLFASRLLNAGLPVQDVARVLGHSVDTLLKVYTHVLPGSNDRVAAAIDGAVSCGIFAGSAPLRVVGGGA